MKQLGLSVLLLLASCAPMSLRDQYPQVKAGTGVAYSEVTVDAPPETVVLPEGCQVYGVTKGELDRVGPMQAQQNCRQLDVQFGVWTGVWLGILSAMFFLLWAFFDAVMGAFR